MRVDRSARGVLLAGVLTNATGIVVNYSSSQMPEFIAANIWIAWISLGILTVTLIAVQTRPWDREPDPYEPSASTWRRYTCTAANIDKLPVSDKVRLRRLEYGEGPQRFETDDLRNCELDEDWSLLTEERPIPDGRRPISLPHRFVATGSKQPGRTVAVHIVTDIAYIQAVRPSRLRSTFVSRCKLDRGGIMPFIDVTAHQQGRIAVRSDLGAQGIIVAVEYLNGRPVARSRYVCAVRVGIRYPDDIWISARTGSAISSSPNPETARVAFQSRQEGGLASDVFACDIDGRNMANLTRKSQNSYDGLFRGSEEVAEWMDRNHLQIASTAAPQNGVRIVRDDVKDGR